MPIIALISEETVFDGLQYVGDVIGVFPDDYQFSGTELDIFNFLSIGSGINTKEEVEARLEQISPQIEEAYHWPSDDKYHWVDGNENGEIIQVYRVEGSNKWYKLENDFKFPVNIDGLNATEKQILETTDVTHSSVDSFIRKVVKDITALSGNNIEIRELRNTTP